MSEILESTSTNVNDINYMAKQGNQIFDTNKFSSFIDILSDLSSNANLIKEGFTTGDSKSIFSSLDDLVNNLTGKDLNELAGNLTPKMFDDKFGIGNIDKFGNLTELKKDLEAGNYSKSIEEFIGKTLGVDNKLNKGLTQALFSTFGRYFDEVDLTLGVGKMVENVKKKFLKKLGSFFYIPEDIYLFTLKNTVDFGGNVDYKNFYIRKEVVLKKDLLKVLKFIDSKSVIHYTDSVFKEDGTIASRNSCVKIVEDFCKSLNATIKRMKAFIKEYDGNIDYLNETKKITESIITNNESDEKNKKKLMEYDDKKIKEYEKKFKSKYDNYRSHIKIKKELICFLIKELIVYSKTNLSVSKLNSLLKEFEIRPSIFGTTDSEYGQRFLIKDTDIDIIAPLVKPQKTEERDYGVDFSNKDTTIIPRNKNIKKIYVYLVDKDLHGENNIILNVELYERLHYRYRTLSDEAKDDIGGIGFNKRNINYNESLAYDYTKKIENLIHDSTNIVDIILKDDTKIPDLYDENEIERKKKEEENKKYRFLNQLCFNSIILYENNTKVIYTLDENNNDLYANSMNLITSGGKSADLKKFINSEIKPNFNLSNIKNENIEKFIKIKSYTNKDDQKYNQLNSAKRYNFILDKLKRLILNIQRLKDLLISFENNKTIDLSNYTKYKKYFQDTLDEFGRLLNDILLIYSNENYERDNSVDEYVYNKDEIEKLFYDKNGLDININHFYSKDLINDELEKGEKYDHKSSLLEIIPKLKKFEMDNDRNSDILKFLTVIKLKFND